MDLRFSRLLEEIEESLRHNSTVTVPVSDSTSLLLYADSVRSPDMRYFSGMHVPDPFIALRVKGKKVGIFHALEFGRALKESSFDEVLPLESLRDQAKKVWPERAVGIAEVIVLALKRLKARRCVVPDEFPAGLFQKLQALGVPLSVAGGPVFPEREFKTAREIRAIQEGNRVAAFGIAAAEHTLRRSKIKNSRLYLDGSPLTSERLKFAIETTCLEHGGVSLDTIAAGGDQACDPHHRGSGPLRAHDLIIVDVFPRVERTGYHGDMTRTFLKGKASDAQRKVVDAVRQAQINALERIKNGANGRVVHEACVTTFTERGFETRSTPKGSIGFFHGTGHGLGLAVHELPRVTGTVDYTLQTGAVTTVEPGLYYPGLGGCRIEDVVQVTNRGYRLLSSSPYDWEIR